MDTIETPIGACAHRGFNAMFRRDRITLGLFFPIEAFQGSSPTMANQVELAQRAQALGFEALWFRDVPLLDPGFGDIGQIYDPWVYLGYIAAYTSRIAVSTREPSCSRTSPAGRREYLRFSATCDTPAWPKRSSRAVSCFSPRR